MKLTSLLTHSRLLVPLTASDKESAIRELVSAVARSGGCSDEPALLRAILQREALRSTGIGRGLAVPHGKSTCCSELVMALGKPLEPIDFDSNDGRPAEIIVLLAGPPDQPGPHIQALARISRLMLMDPFRIAMGAAWTPEAVFRVMESAEAD